jgi:nitrogen-specific signal transduction histidine kinase
VYDLIELERKPRYGNMFEARKPSDLEILATQYKANEIRVKIQASLNRVNKIVAASWEPIIAIDRDFQIVTANHAYDRLFEIGVTLISAASHSLRQTVLDKLWTIPELKPFLEDIFEHDSYFKNYSIECLFDRIGQRNISLSARQIPNPTDEPLILLTIVDTTPPKLEITRWEDRGNRSCCRHKVTDLEIGSNSIK